MSEKETVDFGGMNFLRDVQLTGPTRAVDLVKLKPGREIPAAPVFEEESEPPRPPLFPDAIVKDGLKAFRWWEDPEQN